MHVLCGVLNISVLYFFYCKEHQWKELRLRVSYTVACDLYGTLRFDRLGNRNLKIYRASLRIQVQRVSLFTSAVLA